MRDFKLVAIILIFIILINYVSSVFAFSYTTLEEAINKSGYGEHGEIEILYQNEKENIVIFLAKNFVDEYMLVLSTYSENKGKYTYINNGSHIQGIDFTEHNYHFVNITLLDNQEMEPIPVVWGVYFEPKAKKAKYTLLNESGDRVFEDYVEMEKSMFVDIIPMEIYDDFDTIKYQFIDQKNFILFENN
ncbi:hypothetical protein HNQ94_001106 [Salirhabdus euzebyi]|uniref:Uncharacterized protein n=1 Tax=Salirhabdus euzebyi TaxID=394506 RepID=A0A841PV28_9BACI|nr:hypothetical protein [Salirhabdus euzebyi]MBB6452660.1 hypothetical protein [Salirhabdus euzebyi]